MDDSKTLASTPLPADSVLLLLIAWLQKGERVSRFHKAMNIYDLQEMKLTFPVQPAAAVTLQWYPSTASNPLSSPSAAAAEAGDVDRTDTFVETAILLRCAG